MRNRLNIRANRSQQLFTTVFINSLFFLVHLFFVILGILNNDFEGAILFACFGIGLIILIFIIYLLVRKFVKINLYVDKEKIEKIKICKNKEKILWSLKWEDIDRIEYQGLKWWQILNLFYHSMELGIKTKVVVKKKEWHDDFQYFCGITKKEALIIKESFCPKLKML